MLKPIRPTDAETLQRIHVAARWMSEREREASNNLKAERLPKVYCSLVGAHDEIELHGSVTPRSRVIQGVVLTSAEQCPPSRGRARHITAVAHVSAAAGLIRTIEPGSSAPNVSLSAPDQ